MSANYDWELDSTGDAGGVQGGGGDGGNGIAQLREQYKTLKAELKARDEELSALRAQARQAAIKDTLSSTGVNPKIAAFVPADIEPSQDAVIGWLKDNADVFGVQFESQPAAGVSAEEAGRLEQIQSIGRGGAAPAGTAQDLSARIAAATTKAELDAILREVG